MAAVNRGPRYIRVYSIGVLLYSHNRRLPLHSPTLPDEPERAAIVPRQVQVWRREDTCSY